MHDKPVYAATLEEIRQEFNLKRRRSADVLLVSALRKFNSHLAIMAIMDLLSPGHPESIQTNADLDKVAEIYVDLFFSGQLKRISDDYLHGRAYGA
jgi:hypothetical protein